MPLSRQPAKDCLSAVPARGASAGSGLGVVWSVTASATAEPRGYRRAALAVGVSAVLYVAAIAAWIARDAIASRRDAAWLSQPSVQIARLGAHAVVLALAGRDRAGRSGHFELILARKPIAWAYASADRLARGGEVLGSRAMGELADAALVDRLRPPPPLPPGWAGRRGASAPGARPAT